MATTGCDVVFGIDPPAGDAPLADRWSVPVGENAFDVGFADDPSLTPDLNQIIWNRTESVDNMTTVGAIAVTLRESDGRWAEDWREYGELETMYVESTPRLSPDGLTLFFSSHRDVALADELYMSTRPTFDAPWSDPVRRDDLSSPQRDFGASITADALAIVLTTTRGGQGEDIYITERTTVDDPWPAPVPIALLATSDRAEADAVISADGLEIYFSMKPRPGDLHVARRATREDAFGAPVPLTEINRVGDSEEDPWVSPDGHHLYYMLNPNTATAQLMHATR